MHKRCDLDPGLAHLAEGEQRPDQSRARLLLELAQGHHLRILAVRVFTLRNGPGESIATALRAL